MGVIRRDFYIAVDVVELVTRMITMHKRYAIVRNALC